MRMVLIAVAYNDAKCSKYTAFRILDIDSGQVKEVGSNNVKSVLLSRKAEIAGIAYDKDTEFKGTNGSLNRYPAYYNGKLVKNNSVIILGTLLNDRYKICNSAGVIRDITSDRLINLAKTTGISNGKLVERDNKTVISAINGNYPALEQQTPTINKQNIQSRVEATTIRNEGVPADKDNKQEKRLDSNSLYGLSSDENKKRVEESRKQGDEHAKALTNASDYKVRRNMLPIVHPSATSELKSVDENTGLTVEEKLCAITISLQNARPFYYSIYCAINTYESNDVGTMGVTNNTLYFASDFVKERALPELTFILIHELCHLVMGHPSRGDGKEHIIWNIATDLYINRQIALEFGLVIPGEVKSFSNTSSNALISLPCDCLYCEEVDVENDTPELIYNELITEFEKERDKAMQQQQGQGQGQSQGQSGQSQGQSGQGPSVVNVTFREQTIPVNMSGSGDLMSSNDDSNDQSQGADGSSGQNKKAGFNDKGDFVLDDESVRLSHEQARDRAKNLAERARQIHKQMPHAGGHVDSWIEAQVDLLLAPKVNWKQLLRSKLVSEIKRESSFSSPDRRFLGKHKALPGPRAGVPDTLKNVIIAIDTSGSISEQELGMALGQVKQLLDIYKASAHLLYWDTAVRTDEPFTNINEALRVRVAGRGGTDANCVFSYLTSKAYAKKHKSNNLPSIVIMFTDGGFSTPDEKWKKKFRDTVWVICGGLADKFEAPFGKKASFKNED